MTKIIRQLAQRLKGTMQQDEDWWHLVQAEGGDLKVRHTWSHTDLKTLRTDSGERLIEAAAFLEEDHPWASEARDALRAYMDSEASD